ncbi:MAG: hypothetical protein KBS91_01705, partial [Firmicutes bacterium]|nr:hypothetical protein [Candidatus Caballimonas caccae]
IVCATYNNMLVLNMEILEFLLYFFLEEYGGEEFLPILETMKQNDFDIVKTFKNIPPEKLVPVIRNFLRKKEPKEEPSTLDLSAIENIANSEILRILKNYLLSVD